MLKIKKKNSSIDITAIILTYNEERHIKRCILSIKKFVKKIIIVDSFSTDKTLEIAKKFKVKIYKHKFINQAKQINWVLKTKKFHTNWILRIDADELRSYFEDYDGTNSVLFQAAASTLLNKVHDLALKNSQSFILDGTLSKYGIAEENIERSLKRVRSVIILYVYQTPERAWEFVQEREQVEGRRILPETFVEQYFAARDVVNDLKRKFGKNIQVDLLLKELDGSRKQYKANIDKIDNHISERYSRRELQDRIK